MGINDVIVFVMIIFSIIGAIDKWLGNKWGLGSRFTDGFMAMGSLALAMIGIVSLAPVIANILTPVITPIYSWIGADPAMFANTLLAVDMGGYALAQVLAGSKEAELFAWVFLGTMMGPTIVFTIPVALSIIQKEDHVYFAKGILIGIITIPLGCLIGGGIAGFSLEMMAINLIPTVLFSLVIAVGLWKIPQRMIRGFHYFGRIVELITLIGLVAIMVQTMTGYTLISGLAPISEGIQTVGLIAIMLSGAFPMVFIITKAFRRYLEKLGSALGIGEIATAGLVASLAHNIPMLAMMKDMEPRGKIINTAFAVSGAFVLGGHLGFVAGMNKEMVFAMIIGKLFSGVSAILLALAVTRFQRVSHQDEQKISV